MSIEVCKTVFAAGRRAAAVAMIMLLGACAMVGPDYVRPKVKLSPGWKETGDGRVTAGTADYRNWWRVFNDPVLDSLIARAYKENLTLRIAGVRVLEARAQLGIAVGEFYPQTQQAAGSLLYERASASTPTSVPSTGFLQSQIGVNAAWELDFWGKFRRGIESADADWLASVANYDNAMVSLTADVANAYISIRTLQKRIIIARQNAEVQKETLDITEARFRFGTVTELDVEQAKTSLDNTLATIPALQAQLRQSEHALSVLLGLPPGDLPVNLGDNSDIPVSPRGIIAGIPSDLLRRRPDIRLAEYQAAAQSAQIGVAKADLYPAFSLSGNLTFTATDIGASSLSDMFKWSSRSVSAGPSFQWNILNYGRITNNVRVQDARLQELLIAYQNTVLTAQQEVEDNLAAFLEGGERARLLAQSAAAARKAFDLAVLQYRQGIKDFTTVLTAQQALLTEQDSLAVTLGSISASLVGVYRALGGGWEVREGKELVPREVSDEMAKRTDWGSLLAPTSYNPPIDRGPEDSVRVPDW